MLTSLPRSTGAGLTAALLSIVLTQPAAAAARTTAVPATPPTSCASQPTTTKAFAAFGDLADYVLAPGGSFEAAAGWDYWTPSNAYVAGGRLSAGNETLGLLAGTKSLDLTGTTGWVVAESPAFCIDATNPYFRYAVKPLGAGGTLNVTLDTDVAATQIASTSVTYGASSQGRWLASTLNPLSLAIAKTQTQAVSVRLIFQTYLSGANSGFRIDDVYVDPYRTR